MLVLKKDSENFQTILPTLEELGQYKNPYLIERYNKDHPDNKMPAEQALTEILKYFWLCQKQKFDLEQSPNDERLQFDCAVHKDMNEIDDMWHTFILFTVDYMNFCDQYFGEFIHHQPNTSDEAQLDDEAYAKDLTKYLSYIYDELGEQTVRTWFAASLEVNSAEDSHQHDHDHAHSQACVEACSV